jgi:FlaA1/EpsC-like NDP-sugar epimerase
MRHFKYFSKNYLPRWIILLFDLGVVVFSWYTAFLLRLNFDLSGMEELLNPLHLVLVLPVVFICFWISKSYSGILRHSTTKDIVRIIAAMVSSGLILTLLSLSGRYLISLEIVKIPISVIIIFSFLVTSLLIFSRLLAKFIFQQWFIVKKDAQKVMIFGAGNLGRAALNAIAMDASANIHVVGFIDDNPSLHNKYISGIRTYSVSKAFDKVIPQNKVNEIIFAIDSKEITHKRKREITDMCINLHLVMKEVPPVKNWIKGELKAQTIRNIRIEDLLGRNSIQLDRNKIEQGLKNSVVFVTGAAGSIGSEIVRQLISFKVRRIILMDKAESDLYNLQQELISNQKHSDFVAIVGDVTNKAKLRKIFIEYTPTIVFNAAAYKHVPLMEEFPSEALRVNVGGNKIMADLSIEFGVEKFVFISTDKAVNPTNVMGATKRISETYIQALAQSGRFSTQFIITRFGNVLGSNGSVVPLFKKQIEKGGPVTVTHKDITRYFMTIPEACQLVLEAGFMGKGGEIFVFDMGEPVKLYDLAKKMISLSGYVPNKDIEIKIVGLRPGEKLYEELLDNKQEVLRNTLNDKIMIGKDRKHDLEDVNNMIIDLLTGLDDFSRNKLVEKMMYIVPEFNSMNSYYGNVINVKPSAKLNLTEPILNTYSKTNKNGKTVIIESDRPVSISNR